MKKYRLYRTLACILAFCLCLAAAGCGKAKEETESVQKEDAIEADGVLLSGDSLFQGAIGRCDLPGGNMTTLVHALSEKVMTLPEAVCVLPGHGPVTTIRQEKLMNPYL